MGSHCRRRCARRRTTRGTRSRRLIAPAWASICPTGCSGRAMRAMRATSTPPRRSPPMRRNRRDAPMSAVRTEASAARRARIARLGGLYAVTPDIGDTALLTRKVAAAIAGGAAAVQYRNKLADSVLRRDQARAIARLPVRARTLFIVNDDAALAADVDAD